MTTATRPTLTAALLVAVVTVTTPARPTLTAALLVTVVHAVEHVVAVPAPRDAVGAVKTQKLVLSALLHTADL